MPRRLPGVGDPPCQHPESSRQEHCFVNLESCKRQHVHCEHNYFVVRNMKLFLEYVYTLKDTMIA